jgi:hypothetical protein
MHDESYFRPRDHDVPEAYRKAVPYLTITETEQARNTLESRKTE